MLLRHAIPLGVVAAAALVPFAAASADATTFRVSASAGVTTIRVDGDAPRTVRLAGTFRRPSVVRGRTEGVAHDRGTLVLEGAPGAAESVFAVVERRTGWEPRLVRLAGRFAFDALSPDGRLLYLTQTIAKPAGHYRVRVYDLRAGRLRAAPVAEKGRPAEPMSGRAVSRVLTADGEWVFTLYRGGHGGPFIHALYSEHAVAVCLDLRPDSPAERATDAGWRLKLADDGTLLRAVNELTAEARSIDLSEEWPRLLP